MALYFRLDVMILARLKPPDDVGQYGAGYRFLEAFTVVPTMIMSVLAPVLARSFMEGAGVLQRRYGLAMHLVSVIAIGVSVGGAMTAWRVLPALPGFGAFDGGGVALAILSPAAGLILVGTIAQGALIAAHRQQRLLRISAAGLAFNLVLNLVLIPPYSYVGAAIATTATEVLLVALSLREVRLRLSLRWPLARLWPVLGATAAMAAAIAAHLRARPVPPGRDRRRRLRRRARRDRRPAAEGPRSRSGTCAHDRAARRRRDAVPARVGHAPAQRAPRPPAGRAARGRDGRARAARATRTASRTPVAGVPHEVSRLRALAGSALRPYSAAKHQSEALARYVAARAPAVVQAQEVWVVPAARAAGRPVILDAHNVERDLLRSFAAAEPRRLHRARWRWEARKAGGWEGARVREATAVCAMSDHDAAAFERYGAREVLVVPNGVDTAAVAYREPAAGAQLLFVGHYGYQPNAAAARELAGEILPRVREQCPGATLELVGREPPAALARRPPDGVRVTGAVPDVLEHLHAARAVVIPLRSGSGTRLKVLEALAAGVPVISTPLGVQGLEVRHGEDVLIGETPGRAGRPGGARGRRRRARAPALARRPRARGGPLRLGRGGAAAHRAAPAPSAVLSRCAAASQPSITASSTVSRGSTPEKEPVVSATASPTSAAASPSPAPWIRGSRSVRHTRRPVRTPATMIHAGRRTRRAARA